MQPVEKEEIIYGIYDNSTKSLLVRLNDWIIDHTPISLKEKAYFYELLAVMINAGITLPRALQILADKTRHEHFRRIIHTVLYSIEHGSNLSTAMRTFPSVFEEIEVGVVRAGELTGGADIALQRLSEDMNKTLDLRLRIRQAMTYPVVVFGMLFLSFFIIVGVVVPPLENLFDTIQVETPPTLLMLVAANNFIQYNIIWLIAGVALCIYFFLGYIKTEKGRLWWDTTKLSIPFVKTLLQKIVLARFARSIGILLDSGLPILITLKTTSTSLGNEVYRLSLEEIMKDVQKGEHISTSLEKRKDLYPEDVSQLIAVGEKTATISSSTRKMASQYEREIDHTLKNFTSIIEPLAIICVGIVVGWFAFVVLGAIFSISENIG